MVNGLGYVPARGDVVWASINPTVGHEQSGRRPALVLSSQSYNRRVGLSLICPITRQSKGYPFEVNIPIGHNVVGVVLADQVRSIAWRERKAEYICSLPNETVSETIGMIDSVLSEEDD